MKKINNYLNLLIIFSIILLIFLIYYENKNYKKIKVEGLNKILKTGEIVLKAIEGSPKYFGSIKSISVIQLAEELSKYEHVENIVIYNENRDIIYSKSEFNSENLILYDKLLETDKGIIIVKKVYSSQLKGNPEIYSNFDPSYYTMVTLSKKFHNESISRAQKEMLIVFISIISVIFLLIMLRILFFKYKQVLKHFEEVRHHEEISKISTILAHEIKNPLSSIKGLTNYLYENITNEKLADYLDIILDEIDRLQKIVSDFNNFGRDITLNRTKFSINKVLLKVLKILEDDYSKKGIKIIINGNEFSINADEQKIMQVLINIILNAIKFSPENEQIIIDLQKNILIIMNKHEQIFDENKLFKPFYTTSTKGTGLGLAISKRIIELHGFSISILKSRPFTLALKFD